MTAFAGQRRIAAWMTVLLWSGLLQPSTAHTETGSALARLKSDGFDFNGDGLADFAVGLPFEDLGSVVDAGAVLVVYRSSSGEPQTQTFTIDSLSPGAEAESNDWLGHSVAVGNFNGDAYLDLAVGAPKRDVAGAEEAGSVYAVYGSAAGLQGAAAQTVDWSNLGGGGSVHPNAFLGRNLTIGDFNGDGLSDLAIGAPYDDVGFIDSAGSVAVVPGSPIGLSVADGLVVNRSTPGIPGRPAAQGRFGWALATGRLNGALAEHLFVGEPGRDRREVQSVGAVVAIPGSAAGVHAAKSIVLHAEDIVVGMTGGAHSEFGSAIAVDNFGQGHSHDLAISAPGARVGGVGFGGAVYVGYTDGGLEVVAGERLTQSTKGIPGRPEENGYFGLALAAGNFNSSLVGDLAIGAPYNNHAGRAEAGVVYVAYGRRSGIDGSSVQVWSARTLWGYEPPSEYRYFGFSLASVRHKRDTDLCTLLVGAPGNLLRDDGIGSAYLLGASSVGPTRVGWHGYQQGKDGIPGVKADSDGLGYAVAGAC